MNYFIKVGDEEQGPFTADQIKRRLGEKGYQPTDLVRREDAKEWATLASLDEFKEAAHEPVPLANPMASVSLAFGVLSLFLLLLTPLLEAPYFWIPSLLAIIFSRLASRKIDRTPSPVLGARPAQWGMRLGCTVSFILPALVLMVPVHSHINEKGLQTKAISNCRQIITAMRIYATDHNGNYPDSAALKAMSSNEAFHELFTDGVLNNESIFGCPLSSDGNPDGKIGSAPGFVEALQPGENHWALTKGLKDSSEAIPFVFEAPAVSTWPPRWLYRRSESKDFGRTWRNGKIVIGSHDSSVALLPTEKKDSGFAEFSAAPDEPQLFETTPDKKHEILNVAR
jgi:GYF domain 2